MNPLYIGLTIRDTKVTFALVRPERLRSYVHQTVGLDDDLRTTKYRIVARRMTETVDI